MASGCAIAYPEVLSFLLRQGDALTPETAFALLLKTVVPALSGILPHSRRI